MPGSAETHCKVSDVFQKFVSVSKVCEHYVRKGWALDVP